MLGVALWSAGEALAAAQSAATARLGKAFAGRPSPGLS
jgi:hypothetical protein